MSATQFGDCIRDMARQAKLRRRGIFQPMTEEELAICEAADRWEAQQRTTLYRLSGWTFDEIGQWLLENDQQPVEPEGESRASDSHERKLFA